MSGPSTSYGTWLNVAKSTRTVEEAVATIFDAEGTDGFDVEAIVTEYRNAINAALPNGVTLAGNDFYGPYNTTEDQFNDYPADDDGDLDLAAIVDGVELWPIIERHHTAARTD